MLWLYDYLAVGMTVFAVLAYGIDSERPPRGWWRDQSFVFASAVVVLLWPMVLWLWIRKRLR